MANSTPDTTEVMLMFSPSLDRYPKPECVDRRLPDGFCQVLDRRRGLPPSTVSPHADAGPAPRRCSGPGSSVPLEHAETHPSALSIRLFENDPHEPEPSSRVR